MTKHFSKTKLGFFLLLLPAILAPPHLLRRDSLMLFYAYAMALHPRENSCSLLYHLVMLFGSFSISASCKFDQFKTIQQVLNSACPLFHSFQTNSACFKFGLFQIRLVSNSACSKFGLFQIRLVSNSACFKFGLFQIRLASNSACFKFRLFQIQLVSNSACEL